MTKILKVCEMLFRIHFKKLRHRRLGLISCDERVQLNMNERQLCVEEREKSCIKEKRKSNSYQDSFLQSNSNKRHYSPSSTVGGLKTNKGNN